MSDKIKGWLERFKSSRKMQIGLCVLVAIVVLGVYLIFLKLPRSQNKESDVTEEVITSDADAYARNLETKLEKLLSSIKGAGKVNVLITLSSGFSYVYATETTVKQTSSGEITSTEVVLVGGEPVIEKTIFPVVSGVLVSATGAEDVAVKLRLTSAIQTVIDVANEDITILLGQ